MDEEETESGFCESIVDSTSLMCTDWIRRLSVTKKEFKQPENILGAIWYPTAVPDEPSGYCFLASVRESPVKLLDASDGRVSFQECHHFPVY